MVLEANLENLNNFWRKIFLDRFVAMTWIFTYDIWFYLEFEKNTFILLSAMEFVECRGIKECVQKAILEKNFSKSEPI